MTSENSKPLLPLRDIVIFPSTVIPLFVGRKKVNQSFGRGYENRQIHSISCSKKFEEDDPTKKIFIHLVA